MLRFVPTYMGVPDRVVKGISKEDKCSVLEKFLFCSGNLITFRITFQNNIVIKLFLRYLFFTWSSNITFEFRSNLFKIDMISKTFIFYFQEYHYSLILRRILILCFQYIN